MGSTKDRDAVISKIKNQILSLVSPVKIILFGSSLQEGTAWNDIDLLIVMPDGTDVRKISRMLYRNIRGILVPYDLIITTVSSLEQNADNPGLIYREILRKGKDIHAA
ncbi:MAG: nucleotidyltransferase domain-containing protein [Spirochaetia bacterium]|nr:nucleotidyltransferase domain-containing protein [Spirochaetia bacterium]